MKRNAIIRIILWSMVLVILTGILMAGMFGTIGTGFRRRQYAAEATAVPLRITEPTVSDFHDGNALAASNVNIRTAPSTTAAVAGMLEAGESVVISRQESVDGRDWAYISEPVQGWVVMQYLSPAETPAVQETMVSAETNTSSYGVATSVTPITEIDIEWVAGDIHIQPGSTDQITVEEDGNFDEKYAMVVTHKGTKLEIDFCRDTVSSRLGISTLANLEKDLTITVPVEWFCQSLEVDAASANLKVYDLTMGEVDFDGASGVCEFENCTVDELDIDTASGNVRFIGALEILNCDAASAGVYAVLSNVPNRLSMDMMSGDLDLTLPQDAGFTLAMDTASGNFTTDFETTIKNNQQVSGDGDCRISISALSGDVAIHKGE